MATAGLGNSGSAPSDVEAHRQALRENAVYRFDELDSKYNITDERREEFNNLIDKLSAADTIEALDKIDCDINDLLRRIENEASGGSESPAKEYRLTIKQDTMTLGTDIEAFLEEYFVGTSIVAAYSDGTEDVAYTFDNPGYANISGEYDSVGDVFCIEVSIGLGSDTVNLRHYVRVVADLSDAEATVYYFDSASVFGDMLTLYRIADGSLVCEADGSQSAAELQGNVLTVFAPIATYVLELYTSGARNTVKYYQPTEAPFVTLTQNEGDATYSVSFYGDYDVAGEYIMILNDVPEERMNGLSIYSYINLEARLFNFPLGGGDTYLQFLEDFTIAPMSFTDSDECFFDIAVMNPASDDIAIDQRLYHDFANSLTLEELLEIWCPIAGYPTDGARVIINNELVSDYTIEISPRDRVWIAPSDAIIITGIFNYSDSTETMQAFLPAGATLEVFVGMYGAATRDIYINDEPIDYEANRELVLKEGDKISATIGGEDVTPEAPENPGGTENGGEGGGDVNGFDPEKVTDTWEYKTDPSLMGVESITVYALNDGSYYMYDGHGTYLPVSLWHDRTVSLSMGGVTMLITLDDTNDTAYWYGGSSEVIMTVTSADGTKTAIIYNDTHATDGMYVARLTNGEGNTWTALISYDSGALTITAIPLGWYNEIITLTDKDKGTVGNSDGSDGGDIEETQASYTLYHILDYSSPAYKQTVYMSDLKGVSLTGCVPEFGESAVVLINGQIIPKEEYGTTFICEDDVVIIAPDGYFVITVGSLDKGSQQVLACEHCTVSWVAETYGYDAYDTIYRAGSMIEDANTEYVYEGDLLDFSNGSAGSILESDRYSTHVYESLDEAGEIMYLMLKPGLVVTLEDYMKDNGFSLDTHDVFLNGVRVSEGSDMLGQVIGVRREDVEGYDHIIVAPKGATIFELNRNGRATMHAVVRDGTSIIDAAEIYKLDTSAPIYLNGEVITDLNMVITDGDTLSASITEDVYETAADAVTE